MPSQVLRSHNSQSLDQALRAAQKACEQDGSKFTELREQVLRIIWQAGKPIGAYEIIAELEQLSGRTKIGPPTVYRTLEFLQRLELIHRVHSLNAFLARNQTRAGSMPALFICRKCKQANEVVNSVFQQAVNLSANEMKFQVDEQMLEVLGLCQHCRRSDEAIKTSQTSFRNS
ncbi:Fur family transcriptional regulator [Agaribacterium haliotis]|uniref:Fur family transcriptional regulator n=1 Tax=Agaribacterium haliotis TaxID=2013869 RepID=UPI000BB59107|nr:Fur family transcriptional regulator [Agaribacterium haliotis]